MPALPPRSTISQLLLLTVGCSGEMASGDGFARPPGQAGVAPPVAAEIAAVEVDERPPVPLDQWRSVNKAGEAAARVTDLDQRIEQCRAFVEQHPEHQVAADVFESLSDALIEKGGFDPAELSGCLEAKARLEDDASVPADLVERYHLKQGLPVQSGLRMLSLSRERLDQDQKELAFEKDERRRESTALRIAYRRSNTYVLEARLHLRDGKTELALEALDRGRAESTKLAKDISLRDAEGLEVRSMAAGVLEELDILTAEAKHRKGDDAGAREALGRGLGFTSDLELRDLYDRLSDTLQVTAGPSQRVTAAPQPAQVFELKDLSGKKVSLRDYRGKVVLVTFWATWCGPCKKEMPELRKFQEANRDKGVEVVAISIDSFDSRSKIKPFLEKNNLSALKVLLEEPEQLTDYNYRGIPALYVVDRQGKVVHARTGYDPQLGDKLQHEIKAIVDATGDGEGRELLTIDQAPSGWGVRWKQPISGSVRALAVAPSPDGIGEIGAVGRSGLMRWDGNGKELEGKPLAGWTRTLASSDLDGDGKREWIVGGYQDIKVLDHTGELYWEHKSDGMLAVAGQYDLNGDGFQEILLKDDDRVVAMKAVPDPMWTSAPFKELESVVVNPAGGLVVQADGELFELDPRGAIISRGKSAPEGRTLSGRIETPEGTLDVFEGQWDPSPQLDRDIDGDGRDDVIIAGRRGVVVYDRAGQPMLRVRSHDVSIEAAVGDLDGKAGDEIVLFVEHYGLVVLGRT